VVLYFKVVPSALSAGQRSAKSKCVAVLLSFIVLVVALAFLIGPAVAEPAGPLRVEVTAKRYVFQPAEITVRKGQHVDLVVRSADVAHGLRVRELNLDIKINKGSIASVNFTPEKIGTFVGHCSVFCGSGHGQMTLTIHVVD